MGSSSAVPIPRTVASFIDITPQAATILDQLPAFHQREKTMISAAPAEPEQLRLLELLAKFQQSAREHAYDEPDRPGPGVLPNRLRRRGLGRLDDNNTEGARRRRADSLPTKQAFAAERQAAADHRRISHVR